jgi:tetratricopeptide (TPR) repeat protein
LRAATLPKAGMARNRLAIVLLLAFAVSWAVRLNNAFAYPALRAFDGFGHFTYIWFMAEHWRVPLPDSGWSFFHPPLYYWLMASIWTLLDHVDAVRRLSLATSVTATLGLTQGVVVYLITRRYFPGKPLIQLVATLLVLFLPVHLFTAGYLGNESLNAVICSLTLLATLWVLRDPGFKRGLVLGVCFGAAMLTKFTAVAFVAGAIGSIGLQTLVRRNWKAGFLTLVAATGVLVSMSGWFYARNIVQYGDPFKVSRDEFLVRRHENLQTTGKRDLLEYVLFDPLIILRPQWPRGVPLSGELPKGATHSSLRESVWTGVFANAFFDAVGAQVLPQVTHSEESRRAGQLLLTLGLLPTILVLVGIASAVLALWRRGWDDTLVPMLLTFVCMIAIFVQATRTVPMNAAVKATYMTPASVIFAFWFALGADRLAAWKPAALRFVAGWMVVLAVASSVVFSIGVFLARGWLAEASTNSPVWKNLYGIVYYAAGDRARARELFEAGTLTNWHLSHENLAAMALEEGRPLEALYQIRSAAKAQPSQSYGTPADRATYDRITKAEYLNTMAVIYHRLGWLDEALDSARKAYALEPAIPEVSYDLALLTLQAAVRNDGTRDETALSGVAAECRRLLSSCIAGDENFFDAHALAGSLSILEGKCDEGMKTIADALSPPPDRYRFYPVTTGQGDIQAGAIRRRVHITDVPASLRPSKLPAWCAK